MTTALATSLPTWGLFSSSTTRIGWNSTASPSPPCMSSTSMTSPVFTRCCLPPALITAYMSVASLARSRARRRRRSDLVGDQYAAPTARGTGLRERVQEAPRHPLAGDLEDPERAAVEHLGTCLV